MADMRDLTVRIRGDTKDFTDSMKGVKSSSDDSHMSFMKLTTAVAAGQAIFAGVSAAISKTVGFLKDSVTQYEESERNSKQLEHAVLDVTKATREQLKATSDLADQLAQKGVLDDDVIRAGQAQLSTFGLTNASVQKLSKAMADLTVNQSGVSATSEDAISSANIMAKALNGNYGALEKMGIHLTNTQRQLIKYGDETKKVNTINEVMAANLRTNQATALETTEGKMAHLNVVIGNMKEAIGKVTVDALTPFMNALGKFVSSDTFQGWVKKTGEFMQNDIKPIFVWLVNTGIPNLVDFGKKVYEVGSTIINYLKPSFDGLWDVIQNKAMPALKDLWHNVLEPLMPIFSTVLVEAVKLTIDIFSKLLAMTSDLIKFFADHRQVIIDFGIAFGVLAGYMAFNAVFNALTIGFNTLTLITIPSVMASVASLQALIAAGTLFGPIAIAAALIALAMVYDSAQKTKQAVDAAFSAQVKAADQGSTIVDIKKRYEAGKITKTQEMNAINAILKGVDSAAAQANAGFASGGYTGAGGENEVAGVVHKGEYVVPKSGVDQTTGTPKVAGNTTVNLNVNVGMYAGMPVEKREIALDMWKELVRAARAQGVQLPMIGAVGVQ